MLAILLFTAGCTTVTEVEVLVCDVDLELSPISAAPGEIVTAFGGPFISDRDSVVFVDGVRAEVVQANGGTDDCLDCYLCRDEIDCEVCDDTCSSDETQSTERQSDCDRFCAQCTPELQFVVPDLVPGDTSVVVFGDVGTTDAVPFTVVAPPKAP